MTPDVDNLAKAILDALTPWGSGGPKHKSKWLKCEMFKDDAIVVDSRIRKYYAPKNSKAGAVILIDAAPLEWDPYQ